MESDLNQIAPEWAWAAFEPDAQRVWNRQLAAHLYRRSAFGGSPRELDEAVRAGTVATVQKLVRGHQTGASKEPNSDAEETSFESAMDELSDAVMASGKPESLGAWWLYRMNQTPDPLLEKLTLFWHGHFATSAAKVNNARLMKAHDALLRRHARGRFGDLTLGIAQDPAMLIWLDSQANRKARPNENFARELMELFCLGPGHYTEGDIREMARAFTGWEVQNDVFHVNSHQHDTRSKTFLGRTGEFDGADAVRIVVEQPAASRFIARKLVQFFVCDEPALPGDLVEPLAAMLRHNHFTIAPVLERMFSSNLFYSSWSIGRKVRSPVDLAIGFLRAFEASTNHLELNRVLGQLGQALYYPPNVKGWEGGRAWLNSATYLGRANLMAKLVKDARFKGGTPTEMSKRAGLNSREETLDWLLDLLVASPPASPARQAILESASTKANDKDEASQLIHAISLLPEFQLA